MAYGIGLVFDEAVTAALVGLQNRQAKLYGLTPMQGRREYLPHITVIQAADGVLLTDATVLCDPLHNAERIGGAPLVEFAPLFYRPMGWYFVGVRPAQWLQALHEGVFRRLRAVLRGGDIERAKDIDHYDEAEKANYLQYGYRYLGAAWRPHVTIGRTADCSPLPNDVALIAAYQQEVTGIVVQAAALNVYQIGVSGGYARTVASVPLERGNRGMP